MIRLLFAIFCVCIVPLLSTFAQNILFNQSGNAVDTWTYTSTGADATAQNQAVNPLNFTSAPQSLVVGGNTSGGSCIDGGTGNGPSEARTFTFESVDISSSNQFARTLTFNWGNRHPVCTGTGWDNGENLIFIPIHDGIEQEAQTLAVGGNDAIFWIHQNSTTYTVPPCVNTFGFILYVFTNRRDELLFLDDVLLTTPGFNQSVDIVVENLSVCENELPISWNGINISEAGTYNATLIAASGCDSLVQLNLTVLPFPESNQDIFVCVDELPVSISGTLLEAAGLYTITVPNPLGCDSLITISLTVFPSFVDTSVVNICANQMPYNWQGQEINTGGFYSNILSTAHGCDSILVLELNITPLPTIDFSADQTSLTTDNTEVNFTNNSTNLDDFSWDFGDGTGNNSNFSPTHFFPNQAGEYVVTFTASSGECSSSNSLLITILENIEFNYILPNVFTPNNDGSNDFFSNMVSNVNSMELQILNRWGNLIFQTTDENQVWDGNDQQSGLPCPEGTYFYKLIITDKANENHVFQSFLHLVR